MIEAYLDKLEQACRAKGIDKFEIRYQCEANAALQVYEQKVSDARDNSSESVSLVVLQDGKKGRFETADFDEAKIPLVVDEALANARAVDTEETFFFHDGSGDYHQVMPYQPLAELAELDKIRFLKDLERLAYEADGRINKVIKTCLAEGRRTLTIRNSLGLNLNRETNRAYAYIYLSAKEGDIVKTDSEAVCFNRPQDFDPRTMVEKAVPRLLSRLNAADVKSGPVRAVFEREVAGDLLEAMCSIFSSYHLDIGATKLKGKVGTRVASPLVSIVDDPWLEGGLATVSFDGEGVPTKYKELVSDGVLQGFVYGLALADKHKTVTTGNGGGGLHPMFFNLYLKNGMSSPEELLQKLEDGVYIDKLNGLGAGMNVVSGDFSIGAEGFEVVGGKIGRALNQFTIAGNIYDFLQDIEAVGNDLDLSQRSVASPSLLVKNLTAAGS